ncbi:endoplasmic reticulum vesicle transporter-domain-containing protein [Gautieria morchelliformis]|nr:endoplasmic reticulum vesicle transporter-domain-containing protein [Gautieria morchelliformis]
MEQLESIGPDSLRQFDAFPKLPSTYRTRTQSGGFLTLFVAIVSFLLVVNDIAEFIWGWPDYEFSVDKEGDSFMNVNVDLVVNTPCRYISVDLRDALGDRLHLSDGFHRDGVSFDVSQATKLKQHSAMLSARQAVAQSRRSRGFFSFWRPSVPQFRPTYKHEPDGSACRVYGSLEVKKVTANLHITTLGHGYASHEHTDHNVMNMSHVISEFSFGPYFPDITQPLDYSFEVTDEHLMAYQYYLTVVPTTFIAPRSAPLRTHQYSVTHYERVMEHNKGAPGIFFKFDLEPLALSIHQRTTTFIQLLIRCVGVIGGVWVCTGWTVKVGSKVTEVVTGPDKTQGIVAAEATGVKKRWGGGDLRSRPNAGSSPYTSYAGTPMNATFSHAVTPVGSFFPTSAPGSPLPPPPSSANFSPLVGSGSPSMPPPPHATSPFPPSPLPGANGFPSSPNPRQSGFPPSPMAGQGSFTRPPASPDFLPRGAGSGHPATRSSSGLRHMSGGDELKKVE